jgi:putative flippase GtrA
MKSSFRRPQRRPLPGGIKVVGVRDSDRVADGRLSSSDKKSLLGLLSRFGAAGVFNTVLGAAIIAGLDMGLHVEPHVANLVSYAIGVTVSFGVSRNFVFRSTGPLGGAAIRFLVAIAVAFALNQAALTAVMGLTRAHKFSHIAGQLAGMATYTVALFIACQLWVFKPARAKPPLA